MNDELPDVASQVISWDTVDALFDDLSALTEIREVRLKGAIEARAGGASADLPGARAALVSGSIVGVQIRYRHDGVEWCDTLMREGQGVRVVRVAVPVPAAGGV